MKQIERENHRKNSPADVEPAMTWYAEMFSRAGVESMVVVIILAMLFRTFEAEGFVIPTGSMAPTLHGRHKDLYCDQCGIQFQVGAALETEMQNGLCMEATCPNCRFAMKMDLANPYQHAFGGDRIYVNKLAFQIREPRRYEPIVFKYPGNPKQNYIKRLIGLPQETIRLHCGDVFVKDTRSGVFDIARKPPHVLRHMLQTVHDADFVSEQLVTAGLPKSWRQSDTGRASTDSWKSSDDRRTYRLHNDDRSASWLHYRHIVPTQRDWAAAESMGTVARWQSDQPAELISDFYGYNSGVFARPQSGNTNRPPDGMHWVGDLAVEFDVRIESESGELLVTLVEGGRHHQCRFDVHTGKAMLSIDRGKVPFTFAGNETSVSELTAAKSGVRGPGPYRIMFANADDQLLVWVDDSLVRFNTPDGSLGGTFSAPPLTTRPVWRGAEDAGDLEPVRIGGRDVQLSVSRLRVLRDVYYIAADGSDFSPVLMDYDLSALYASHAHPSLADIHEAVNTVFRDADSWSTSRLFDLRRAVEFTLGEDDFFPLGDNSPQSKDARIWHTNAPPHVARFVRRDMLVGSPFVIYWPHPWPAGTRYLPIIPNFRRFGVIR